MTQLTLAQSVELPRRPLPIVSIGLGGIVHDGHYPAYQLAGFEVAGGFDLDPERARLMQARFGIPVVYGSLAEAVEQGPPDAVFDVAVPGSAVLEILQQLPPERAVLIQKPLGEDLDQAHAIVEVCRAKRFKSAVNFQMRFVPYIIAARDMIAQGLIGEVNDLEMRVQTHSPWEMWSFFAQLSRVEILYHSIHYVDLFRYLLGEPDGVYAKTLKHPLAPHLAATRSTIILDYGERVRATITANHGHPYGPEKQECYIKWEGLQGAIKIRVGTYLGYPHGVPDLFEYVILQEGQPPTWQTHPIHGTWFPNAFIGPMASLMRFAQGETGELSISTEDALKTMAVVEAAYESSERGSTPIPPV